MTIILNFVPHIDLAMWEISPFDDAILEIVGLRLLITKLRLFLEFGRKMRYAQELAGTEAPTATGGP